MDLDQNALDQIENDLNTYERGRQLRPLVNSPLWEILVDSLESYRDNANQELVNLAPGDPTVPTVHAAVSAIYDLVAKFQQDVHAAVNFANNPSEELRKYLTGTRDANDVAKAMGQGV